MSRYLMALLALTVLGAAQETTAYTPSSARALTPVNQFELDRVRASFTKGSKESVTFVSTPRSGEEEFAPVTMYLPFFSMGIENLRRFNPAIAITNNGPAAVDLLVEFVGRDGKALNVAFRDENGRVVRYAGASGTVEPGQDVSPWLAIDLAEPVRHGYVRITTDSPETIAVKGFTSAIEATRFGVFAHAAALPTSLPVQLGVENSPRTKQTILSLVNPGEDPLTLSLTPRRFNGEDACAPVMMELAPGAQVQRSTQSLITCIKPGEDNYNLYIEPLDGEVVAQAYYDYGTLVYATAPVHELQPFEPIEKGSSFDAKSRAAAIATCVPTFDPLKPRLTSDENTFDLELDFDKCDPDQTWLLKASSSWFYFVDSRGREVASLAGTGSATVTIRVNAAPGRRAGGNRYGYLYLHATASGRQGKRLTTYKFSQPIPRL